MGTILMTLDQATEEMELGKGTLKTWIVRKKMPIPFVRINGVIRIRRSDVEAFLEKNLVCHDVSQDKPKRRGRKVLVADLMKNPGTGSK